MFGIIISIKIKSVVIKASLGLLDAVHAAPDGGFAQGQVIDVLNAVKGQRVEQDQTFQPVYSASDAAASADTAVPTEAVLSKLR